MLGGLPAGTAVDSAAEATVEAVKELMPAEVAEGDATVAQASWLARWVARSRACCLVGIVCLPAGCAS